MPDIFEGAVRRPVYYAQGTFGDNRPRLIRAPLDFVLIGGEPCMMPRPIPDATAFMSVDAPALSGADDFGDVDSFLVFEPHQFGDLKDDVWQSLNQIGNV